MSEYTALKLIHLGALIFWLGPALGAWLVLKATDDGNYIADSTAAKVSRVFYLIVALEHVAFTVLLTTGFIMAIRLNLLEAPWLTQKLIVVLVIVLPLEIIDVFLGNWLANNASKKLYSGQSPSHWEKIGLKIYHGIFTKVALVLIPSSVLVIMSLAIGKVGY